MSPSGGATAETIGTYVLQEFLPGEAPQNLTPSTPLISTGILDSIARLKLVEFLEETFHITIAPAEVDVSLRNDPGDH